MDKTKVRMSPLLRAYRAEIAGLLGEICDENRVRNAGLPSVEEFDPVIKGVAELGIAGLLRPPKVEVIMPEVYWKAGRLEGLIQIYTSEYFGVMNVFVALEDEQGHIVESGDAMDTGSVRNHWAYVPSAALPRSINLIVRVVAQDGLGAIGMKTERVTVQDQARQGVGG